MSLIYVAGKYRGNVQENIDRAMTVAKAVWQAGHVAICPHGNTAHFDGVVPDERFLSGDLIILARCDAVVTVEDWEESVGARGEVEYAEKLGIPIYHSQLEWHTTNDLPTKTWENCKVVGIPPLHPTEVRCPKQVVRFAEILGQMHRVHLDKNADYSPTNIGGMGSQGIIVRLWDKMCRLMNLQGWNVNAEFVSLSPERGNTVADEKVEDTAMDMANYGVIFQLLREKVWGK
jgi:hypothetical protein